MTEHVDSGDYTYEAPRFAGTPYGQALVRMAALEAQLAAVPVDAIRLAHFGDVYTPGYMDACSVVGDWLIELAYAGTAQDVTA